MKFVYEYRTKENEVRRGEIAAADRDEAFAALKARGIRPSRVAEAPGFFNKLFGKGKRWIGIVVLGVLCVVLAVGYSVGMRERDNQLDTLQTALTTSQEIVSEFDSPVRRQIIGDTAVIEKGIRTGWEEVFPYEGERFLASFAIPGVPAGLRNTNEAEIRKALARSPEASVAWERPNCQQVINTHENSGLTGILTLEARQICAIVEGMKQELRNFIADGRHTIVEYGQRLVQRQEQEIAIYNRAKAEIDAAVAAKVPQDELLRLWESRNDQLRNIGVKLVPLPED